MVNTKQRKLYIIGLQFKILPIIMRNTKRKTTSHIIMRLPDDI